MYKKLLSATLFSLCSTLNYAQIGIGTVNPDKSSILDVESSTKGFLPPRLTSDSQVSSPANGLIIYDETDNCLNVYNGTTWVNLCDGGGAVTPAPSTSNPNLNLDCSGVFVNPLTFGQSAYLWEGYSDLNEEEFTFHLNEDGSNLYSNYGQYYDTNSTINARNSTGTFSATTQVLALKQAFPNKTWKDFAVIDYFNVRYPNVVYLLSSTGTLHSLVLNETNMASPTVRKRFGMTTSDIDPTDDNIYLGDPGSDENDYRYTPINHLVNDVDASITFSSFYHALTSKSPNLEYAIYAYDNSGKKFYSFGSSISSTLVTKSKSLAVRLGRSVEPANLKESITLLEADKLNEVITYFGTEFEEGDGVDRTFNSRYFLSRTTHTYITKDGYVNIYHGNNDIYRFSLPAGVKAKSLTGSYSAPVLGDDGKLYRLDNNNLSTSGFTNSVITLPTLGTINLHEKAATDYITAASNINSLNFKRFLYASTSGRFHGLTADGTLYSVILSSTNTATDFSTPYSIPPIEEILSAGYDLIVKSTDGDIFGITTQGNLSQDLPTDMFENIALDINGYPVTNYSQHRIRLLFNCIGN